MFLTIHIIVGIIGMLILILCYILSFLELFMAIFRKKEKNPKLQGLMEFSTAILQFLLQFQQAKW